MCQHGSVGPSIEEMEMMPAQQGDIPAVTTEAQADREVSDYETRVPQLNSQ